MYPPALLLATACITFLLPAPAAAEATDSVAIERAVENFLDARAKTLPGPARHKIGPIRAASIAPGCRGMKVSMDPGARPWGRTHVNVRCTDGASWTLYVPVQIGVSVDYLVSAHPLRAGQTLVEADLARRSGDLADLPSGVLLDPAQVLGRTLGVALPAERPLRAEMLRQPMVVKQGQSVKLVAGGSGFQVSSEGRALGNAVAGQVVQVRTGSGQVVSGIARADGSVEVAH